MLSRVADSVFWMARYLERSDNLLRLLRTEYIASQDEILDYDWAMLAKHFGNPNSSASVTTYHNVLNYLVLDKEHDQSIINNITHVRENARSVQDYITKELWQTLNDFYHRMRHPRTEELIVREDPVTAFDIFLRESIIFYGTVDVTMNRGEGYTFLNLGKYMERCLQCLDVLEFKQKQAGRSENAILQLKYLLYALSGYEFHTKFYKDALQPQEVIHQVLFNMQFPHSAAYSIAQMDRCFQRLLPVSTPESFTEISRLIKEMSDLLQRYQTEKDDVLRLPQRLIPELRLKLYFLNQRLGSLYFGYSYL
ncbi:MAG: alpha-E domain-containing protein [Flammeovirgaceae bacterium]